MFICRKIPIAISTSFRCISNVAVIGGGLMGSGIAQVAAQTGHKVTLVDVSDKVLEKSEDSIKNSLRRVAKKKFADSPHPEIETGKFLDDVLGRLKLTTDTEDAAKNADVIVEAVIEKLEIKHKLFKLLDTVAPPQTLFASNTSSLSIGDIASAVDRKDRFGGMHFFNPVPMMQLVEVIRTPETSDATHEALMTFGRKLGKQPITCKDTLGFVVNRLLLYYKLEAYRLLERGDATARDIDTAMKLGAGYPMGPFELSDYTGLDTSKYVMEIWRKKYPDDPMFRPVEIVERLVAQGKLGRKTGEGFYKYDINQKK